MKLKCYGTAAAEAIPGLYCSCALCEGARALGGKEIRARHMSAVDDDIQFDLGPDLFYQIHTMGFDPRGIRHLIITHSHSDHFSPESINKRVRPFSLKLDREMEVIGSRETIDFVMEGMKDDFDRQGLIPRVAAPFEPLSLGGGATLTALPANHAPGLGAMIYLLERGGKRLLYAHDTGPLFPEVLEWLAGKQLDAVTLDCTGTFNGAGIHHMQLASCQDTVDTLYENGGLKRDGIVMINHFSHGGGALHWQLEEEAGRRGWIAAYDGIEVEI